MNFEYTRKHPRVPLRLRIHCAGEGLFFSDVTKDVSTGGVGIETFTDLKPGQRLEMQLTTPDGSTISVMTTVVWVKPSEEQGRIAAGLSFGEVGEREHEILERMVSSPSGPIWR